MTKLEIIKNLVEQFLKQANEGSNLKTLSYLKSYRDLKVKVSFGQGQAAAVPWIGFLHPTQKPMTGIYPVFLYFKANNILILAYGIGTSGPTKTYWNLPTTTRTIGQYMADNKLSPKKYDHSLVYRVYEANEINWSNLEKDVNAIIDEYKRTVF